MKPVKTLIAALGFFFLIPATASFAIPPPSDITPPVLSDGAPTGTLAYGTTSTTMSLSTNENATCKYGTSDVAYGSLPNTFAATGALSHSQALSGLTNGSSYTYFVRCLDNASNANTSGYAIAFSVSAVPPDTTPPVLSNGAPSGTLAAGTTSTVMSVTTNESASCRYGTTNVNYASLPSIFSTTGFTSHSQTLTGLTNGTSYTYYLRCIDASGNANTSAYTISFSVANPASSIWPLKISPSGSYLEDQYGNPFFVMGDTAWSLGVQLNQSDIVTYLDDRQSKGYSALLVNAIEHEYGTYAPNNIYNQPPFTNGGNNWSVRNEAYWANIDFILNQAKNRNMVVFLTPAYLGYGCGAEGWCSSMTSQTNTAMTDYGQWLGNRYKNQGNIIWVNGGDANCSNYTNACARVNAVASGIRSSSGDNGVHLHTAHSAPENQAMDAYNYSWLNLNTVYSYGNQQTQIRSAFERAEAKPFTYLEGYYENGSGVTQSVLQSQAMQAYLGGALVGHVFGNQPVWYFGSGWSGSAGIDSSGSATMGNIGMLMRSRSWWTMVPDYSNVVVTSSKGRGYSYMATARASAGDTVMVWFPRVAAATVDMTKVSGTQVKAWWYIPASGAATLIGTYPNTGTRSFTPTSAMSVLVLDSADLNLPAPGIVGE